MKKILIIVIAALIAGFAFWSCEKDDICPDGTPTTPRVVIQFFNFENRTVARAVTNLSVTGEGMETPIEWTENAFVVSDTIIRVPLRVGATSTTYSFTINSIAEDASKNTDNLTFNYTTSEIYVSRACGYKSVFRLDAEVPDGPENPLLAIGEDGGWIREITVEKSNIEDENETHVNIYF